MEEIGRTSRISNKLATAIYGKLNGDATLTALLASATSIFHIRPQLKDQPYPYVVFSVLFGGPQNATPSDTQEHNYFIRAYAETAQDAGTIHERIAALLHNGTLTVAGYTTVIVELVEDYENEQEVNEAGNTVYMIGGSYRILLD